MIYDDDDDRRGKHTRSISTNNDDNPLRILKCNTLMRRTTVVGSVSSSTAARRSGDREREIPRQTAQRAPARKIYTYTRVCVYKYESVYVIYVYIIQPLIWPMKIYSFEYRTARSARAHTHTKRRQIITVSGNGKLFMTCWPKLYLSPVARHCSLLGVLWIFWSLLRPGFFPIHYNISVTLFLSSTPQQHAPVV